MIRALSTVIFTLLLALAATNTAKALSVEQVVKKAKAATVLIVVATNDGAQSGTGFAVQSSADSTTIVTANHVVEGETQVDVIFDSSEKERYPAEIVRRDHVKDVAILKVHVGRRPTIALESPDDVSDGMQIVLIGYPLATLEFHRLQGDALQPSVHTGIVSAVRFNGAVLQFDAATSHGDSGGPIIDTDNGRVVAIVHGAELDPSYEARGLEQPAGDAVVAVLDSDVDFDRTVVENRTIDFEDSAGATLAQSPGLADPRQHNRAPHLRHHFFLTTSCSTCRSSVRSATSRLSRAFSSRNRRNSRISGVPMLPKRLRQVQNVASEMPSLRTISVTGGASLGLAQGRGDLFAGVAGFSHGRTSWWAEFATIF